MKLLFDHNLAPSLVMRLADLFPGSQHVYRVGLDQEDDLAIRDYARSNDFVIVTKDVDFSDMCVLLGFPPKIIWIRRGNCSVNAMEEILRRHHGDIESFDADPINGVLTLF
jgi:predicted nuclease of predicted toxin-antitoxin system